MPSPVVDVLQTYGTLAALAGGAWAVLQQIWRFTWRLATVESRSIRNTEAIERLEEPMRQLGLGVARIEAHLEADRDGREREPQGRGR